MFNRKMRPMIDRARYHPDSYRKRSGAGFPTRKLKILILIMKSWINTYVFNKSASFDKKLSIRSTNVSSLMSEAPVMATLTNLGSPEILVD